MFPETSMVNDEARGEITFGNVRRGRLRSGMHTRGYVLFSIAAVLVMLVVTSVPVSGQRGRGGGPPPEPAGPIPRTADGKPDLRGGFAGTGGGLTHSTILEEHGAGLGDPGREEPHHRPGGRDHPVPAVGRWRSGTGGGWMSTPTRIRSATASSTTSDASTRLRSGSPIPRTTSTSRPSSTRCASST